MKFNVNLEKVWTNIKNSYEFLKNLDNFEMFITYHNVLEEVCFIYTPAPPPPPCPPPPPPPPTKTIIIIFFVLNFWIASATNFLPLFLSDYKSHYKATTFTPAQFAQNVLGLTLVLCIVFITDFFPWLHVKWFQSTEVR